MLFVGQPEGADEDGEEEEGEDDEEDGEEGEEEEEGDDDEEEDGEGGGDYEDYVPYDGILTAAEPVGTPFRPLLSFGAIRY